MKKYFVKLILPIVILTGAISLAVTQSSIYRKVGESQRLINQVYNQIFSTYLHELDPEEFTKASINSITQNLDPYTSFMVEDEQHRVNILSKGKYGGVGIQLGYRNKTMSVVAPMDGGPAKKAGIISGDIILRVDDEYVEKFSFNDAAAKIRGEKGTKVKLTVKRFGEDDPIEFNLVRSNIVVKDVTYSGMLTPSTGYVRLNRFSKNTPNEMAKALGELLSDDASEIIIDLRDNPGGLMTSAVSLLDMIIEKNQPLLSTKGRIKDANRTFYSRRNPLVPTEVKIAILINQGSASASEIVAGAVQDLDRGIVIGQKSFGKGLVQTAYSIDDKRAITVTTARYYVPSGRFIQKSDYIDDKYILNQAEEDSVFKTIGGRTVLGGGGITPDSMVTPELMDMVSSQYWRSGFFYSFAQENKHNYSDYNAVLNDDKLMDKFNEFIRTKNSVILPGEKELNDLSEKIANLDSTNQSAKDALSMLNEFYTAQEDLRRNRESDDIKQILLLEFAGLIDGPEGRLKQALKNDRIVKTAMEMITNDEAYAIALSPTYSINN